MEASAIYHSMEKRFCFALGNGKFRFRLKAKKGDIRRVIFHAQDKYLPLHLLDTRFTIPMERAVSDQVSDYFETTARIDVICLRYFFELEDHQGNVLYYSNYRFSQTPPGDIEDMFDLPQTLREDEAFEAPQWAANKIVYQIFPSRFATSKAVPDRVWYQSPMGNSGRLRGDLRGIIGKLPHIRALGADVVYMTPIFQANSYHKYDTVDYYKVDPEFGTEADLRELVEKAHSLGLRVILDAVFNHTSRDFFAFRDILEHGERSRYAGWYFIDQYPPQMPRDQKPSYKTFGYHGYMPKLNLANPQAAEYFLGVARYWMRRCGIDGWRLDVGDEVNHGFWRSFRKAVKTENPQALIIGEAWHYIPDFLDGDQWDTMMNYDFRSAVLGFAAWDTHTPSQFLGRLGFLRGNVHSRMYPLLWNLLDSHDTPRLLHECGENRDKARLAIAIQMLLPGMPMIYYGDEFGLTGGRDPDCRRGMLWQESRQDRSLWQWYRQLIELRKSNDILTNGTTVDTFADDDAGVAAITRRLGSKKLTLIFYNGSKPTTLTQFQGTDLLTGKPFDGRLKPYDALLLEPTNKASSV